MGSHLINGEFQSDKYPTCPAGKVPLSVKDPTAQPLLWEYAQRHRSVDAEFSNDLEAALLTAGYRSDRKDLGLSDLSHGNKHRPPMSTETDLEQVTAFIEMKAREEPTILLLAVVLELVDIACGDNNALRDFKRLQMYRRIAVRLGLR
jgi:hypothetical protein